MRPQAGRELPQLAHHGQAVFVRQADVAEDHVGGKVLHGAERRPGRAHRQNLRPLELQAEGQDLAGVVVVFDDEHANTVETEPLRHGDCLVQVARHALNRCAATIRPYPPCSDRQDEEGHGSPRQGPRAVSSSASPPAATRFTGSVPAFALALGVILVWAITGPIFHFSDTWQLVINTGTTIVTFLMVFLIQQTQNKDGLAIQLKLNELVAALEGASNRLISVEDLTAEELQILHAHYQRLAKQGQGAADTRESHSIEEAERRHSARSATARADGSGRCNFPWGRHTPWQIERTRPRTT